jgi:hypothetical protein
VIKVMRVDADYLLFSCLSLHLIFLGGATTSLEAIENSIG